MQSIWLAVSKEVDEKGSGEFSSVPQCRTTYFFSHFEGGEMQNENKILVDSQNSDFAKVLAAGPQKKNISPPHFLVLGHKKKSPIPETPNPVGNPAGGAKTKKKKIVFFDKNGQKRQNSFYDKNSFTNCTG